MHQTNDLKNHNNRLNRIKQLKGKLSD